MRAVFLCAVCLLSTSAVAGEVLIDDFEGPVAWTPFTSQGPLAQPSLDTEHFVQGKASMRIRYDAAKPYWSNLKRQIKVPPDAVGVAMSIRVHSAEASAAMHFWLFESDGDGWLARIDAPGKMLAAFAPGWQDIVVPIADFRFQPRGTGTRQMTTVNQMQIGCNFGDLDVSVDRLRFVTSPSAAGHQLPLTDTFKPEDGRLGRVAILAGDLPAGPGAADPQKLAEMARRYGYDATLFTSGDVADRRRLSPDVFDVLIVPCAPSYPRAGRDALVAFLKGGGSLISIGGYAFDRPLVLANDGWTDRGLTLRAADMANVPKDPGPINTRSGVPGDTMRLKPEQIGAFEPSYLLEGVARASTAPDQLLLRNPVEIEGPLTGYAAAALIGSNSPVFPDIHARWTPIVNAYDSLGRLRGAVAAVVRHWRGPWAGSSWALLGVENRDLIGDDPAGPAIFEAMLRAVTGPVFLHELSTEFACYRKNETVRASVAISNQSKTEARRSIRFQTVGKKSVVADVVVPPGETRSVEATIHEGEFAGDFHTVTAELVDPRDGSVVDRVTTAFVVWDEDVIAKGPKIDFVENYFTFDGVPKFFCGSNQTGMMWYSVDENPLTWQRDFAKMQSSGLRMLRVLHFSPFASENPLDFRRLGMKVLEGRPEGLLRKTDAIVQLAQQHGVVLFLTLHDWMPVELSDEELDLQRRWARFWADRYKDVPGIIYDVQNEPSVGGRAGIKGNGWHDTKPLAQNMARIDTLNRWIKANAEGVKQGDPDALVTVGFLQMIEPADRLLGAKHVDFNNMHFHSAVPDFAAEMKINDRRFEGKSFSLGEFGARESHDARTHGHDGTMPDESMARFLTMTHESFGMGASFALNWDWKDFDGCVFPWGLNHACDLADKRLLPAYRNISLFLERLRPRYRDPDVYLLVPDSHRLGAEGRRVHGAVRAAINGLFSTHTDFNVINEFSLDRLPAECRTMVWPVPYCPSDETFAKVVEFVRRGGRLYISGDLAYSPERERTRTARFAELGLNDPGEHAPLEKIPAGRAINIQTVEFGAGKVFYVHGPIEFDAGQIVQTLRKFLDFSGEKRIMVEPDDAEVYVFHVPLDNGAATVLSNRASTDRTIQLAEGQLTIGAKLAGLLAVDGQGKVTSVECSGQSMHDGRPITSGTAHVMLSSLDDQDIRDSRHLMLLPVTPGTFKIHTQAKWKDPTAQIGQYAGSNWQPLKTIPLEVHSGTLTLELDDDTARSILILRQAR